ncbi:hypothetical protein BJ138DRAFT_1062409 [Hygrophoropsis aurantiaca]|uniref:Uncharacterized protein n=1 Tax=Hygrophoropsis aurantiaca TaxID=72124 RepID=A0ACB8AF87_9AGAM|nr:hypothetical protein BJ138DRAFT_1062409 [Hygrophoropsis aurantiaca]
MTGKRFRPPNLNLLPDTRSLESNITLESPFNQHSDEDEQLQLSSPSSAASSVYADFSPRASRDFSDVGVDDLSRDLAVLAKLRQSVQKNLRLRPIRSFGMLPKSDSAPLRIVPPRLPSWCDPTDSLTSPSSTTSSVYYTPTDLRSPAPESHHFSLEPPQTPFIQTHASNPLDSQGLYERLSASKRPLLLDTRNLSTYQTCHLRNSVNIAIPSLILKRCRKPGGAFQSLDALRQFITSEKEKQLWDDTTAPGGSWDGDIVIIHGEETDESDMGNAQITAWGLLPVITSLLGNDRVYYLQGGMPSAQQHTKLLKYITRKTDEDGSTKRTTQNKKGRGVFQLDTQVASGSKSLEIEQPEESPLPMMPSAMSQLDTVNGSSPPSQLIFQRPNPPRRPTVPHLSRIHTTSGEQSLPRLQIRTVPTRSATMPSTPLHSAPTLFISSPCSPPPSASFRHSNHTPPASATPWTTPSAFYADSPTSDQPHTPRTPHTPMPPRSPASTARPDTEQPTTEEAFPAFTVSVILPHFLYLGPELTLPEHVEELKALGIKRILNIAAECDDDHGLHLRDVFERYVHIPMRDTVEEDRITRGLKEACDVLDDASLYGASTYVHCRAGKSRSVTAVMAYLIHANHWTLSRAYSFVLERRKGISPNIGFVSELMTFEEQELGGKSVGVVQVQGGEPEPEGYAYAAGSRRTGHVRESLPPMYVIPDYATEGPPGGDVGQEMEVRDSSGRYRHMRRAPVDETTLQPMRRVSKAGLESAITNSS